MSDVQLDTLQQAVKAKKQIAKLNAQQTAGLDKLKAKFAAKVAELTAGLPPEVAVLVVKAAE